MRLAGQTPRVAAATLAADARTPRPLRSFSSSGIIALLALLTACGGESLTDPRLRPSPPDLTLTGGVGTQIFPTVPLGDLQPDGVAIGLNDAGQVTGTAVLGPIFGDFEPFRWSASTGAQRVTGCCDTRWGNDINNSGVIVGGAQTNFIEGLRGFVASGSSATPLSILPGGDPEFNAVACAINDAGLIVGSSIAPGFATHAVLWSAAGVIQDLGTLGGTNSAAIDINNAGQVIGSSQIAGDAATHFFLWSSGTGMQDLNTTVNAAITSVVEINGPGQIIGTYITGGESHAFLFTPGSGLRDLGTLGGTTSAPTGLNVNGDVVGSSTLEDGSTHAFLWTDAEGMEDITALSGVPEVRRLNDKLQTLTGTVPPSSLLTGRLRPRLVQLRVTQSNAPPTALFNAECNGLTCVLDASGSLDDKPGLTFAWSLDKVPGGSATGDKVTVTYPHAGQRTVTLTVTDAQGLKSSISKTLTITDFPIAAFVVNCVGLTCTFDSGASQTDAPPLETHWLFGDGQTAFNVLATSHTFAQPGTYSVTLEVLDSNVPGRFGVITKQVTVGAVQSTQPVAAFTYSCKDLSHAHQCAFDASGSTDDTGIASYRWEWGNGRSETKTRSTVRNTWMSAGTYLVTLHVTDEDGLTAVTSQQVVVP